MYEPDDDGGKQMFPTHGSDSSDGEPDAVKVARPVRWGGWRRPAGATRPSAAPSPPNSPTPNWATRSRRWKTSAGPLP